MASDQDQESARSRQGVDRRFAQFGKTQWADRQALSASPFFALSARTGSGLCGVSVGPGLTAGAGAATL